MRFHFRPRSRSAYERPAHSKGVANFDLDSVSSLLEISARIERLLEVPEPAAVWIREPEAKPAHLIALAGTFNPPTSAHTGLIEVVQKQGAKPAVFVVAIQSVDKESLEVLGIEDRLALLDVISARIGAHIAIVNRGLYADQAVALHRLAPDRRVVFVSGYDKIEQVFDRKYYEDPELAWAELFKHADFLVAQRGEAGFSVLQSLMRRPDTRRYFRQVSPLRTGQLVDKDLSSSSIRDKNGSRVATKALPPKSQAFVRFWQPYSDESRYGLRLRLIASFKRNPELAADAPGLRMLVSTLEREPGLENSLDGSIEERAALRRLIGSSAGRSDSRNESGL